MALSKRLLVGLGNPGVKYANTRHNIGFMVVDALTHRLRIKLETRGAVEVGWGQHKSLPVGLAKPMTYMNRSGNAVRPLVEAHDLDPADVLVIYDDVHLDIGQIRIRPGGSSGGHNGIEHICQRLGTRDVPRLRVGIGSDYGSGEQADYVLSPFSAQQEAEMEDVLITACNAALAFVQEGVDTAMNRFN